MSSIQKFSVFKGKDVNILESQVIKLIEEYDTGYTVFVTRQMSERAGFMCVDEAMIATAASELSTNIIRYAKQGEISISIIKDLRHERVGIEVYAIDSGPGIKDLELAMKEEYSSLPNSLGLGLPSVKRIMDEFYIETLFKIGTRVLTRKWVR